MILTREQSTWIKLFAVVFMIIDHVGIVFFPEQTGWRIIGRLAFPLFAFQLAIGFQHTRNHRRQLGYLGIFAFVSQLPYMWALETTQWNVFFTFAFGYILLLVAEQRRWGVFLLMGSLLLWLQPPVDYGWYGIFLPFLFWWLRRYPVIQLIGFFALTAVYALMGSLLQFFAVGAVALVLVMSQLPLPGISVNKWFFYAFYPAHLFVFAILQAGGVG